MALGYQVIRRGSFGDLNYRIVDITMDAAYPTGGYILSPQQMGFGSNGSIVFGLVSGGGADGFLTEWDETTARLRIRDASGGVGAATPEVAANLAGLNAVKVRVFALGIGHG
jgi:hypothetical protein